jgi:hypothetical protein
MMSRLGRSSGVMRKGRVQLAILASALLVAASPLAGQAHTLTLANNAITFPAPTAADYVTGWINSTTGVTFTVNATATGGQASTTTVAIKSNSANLGNGKALATLQWRRSDLVGAWNTITTTNANVEARTVTFNGANDPWSNTIYFRMLLSWTTDAPAIYGATYQITLTVSQ